MKRSSVKRVPTRPTRRSSGANTQWSSKATRAKAIIQNSREDGEWVNSSIVCTRDSQENEMETDDDLLVTITISDNTSTALDEDKLATAPPNVQITKSILASENRLNLGWCLDQCLKLSSGDVCVCCRTQDSVLMLQTKSTGAGKADTCPSCHPEIGCFLCPESYTAFSELREHFITAHDLGHNVDQLSDTESEYVMKVVQAVRQLDCSCADFVCIKCKTSYCQLLPLMHHFLLEHPSCYRSYSFFTRRAQTGNSSFCQQCGVLETLCNVNYYLFIRVLLRLNDNSDDTYSFLLLWSPSENPSEHSDECSVKRESEELRQIALGKAEVVCYKIMQEVPSGKTTQKGAYPRSECICPLLKCPDCPKTVANFADLRKHVRLNSHSYWSSLRLLWKKYKVIKESCPVCPPLPYHSYILCPHCPHLSFEDKIAAHTHMDTEHCGKEGTEATKTCACTGQFLCFTCGTVHHTPQALQQHMKELGHQTQKNLAAIPTMIWKRFECRKKCPRCSVPAPAKISNLQQQQVVEEQEQEQWAVCSNCGNTYSRFSTMLDQLKKTKHPSSTDLIISKRKLASFHGHCLKCNGAEDRYCILCNKRETFLHRHTKTHHQDCQIMLLSRGNGSLLEEHDGVEGSREPARYQCSVCLQRFLHPTTLRHHVSCLHPHNCYTLHCLTLSTDVLTVQDFAAHREIKVLDVVMLKD